jgi:hypothetical protein
MTIEARIGDSTGSEPIRSAASSLTALLACEAKVRKKSRRLEKSMRYRRRVFTELLCMTVLEQPKQHATSFDIFFVYTL